MVDLIRVYVAFKGNDTEHAADLYFDNVSSLMSIMKTAIYFVETILSDFFIVCLSVFFWCNPHLISPTIYHCSRKKGVIQFSASSKSKFQSRSSPVPSYSTSSALVCVCLSVDERGE